MVGQQHVQMEWQNTYPEGHRSGDRLRCIPGGMGGLLLRVENRGTLVPTGALYAHQLSRATYSNFSSQNLCKGQDCNVYPTENRQHHSSGLHKQSGRDSLQRISDPHKGSMDVVPGKEYPHCTSAPTGCIEYNSRYRFQANADRTDRKLNPVIFQKINNLFGPLKSATFLGP